jgi:hypothetical protein
MWTTSYGGLAGLETVDTSLTSFFFFIFFSALVVAEGGQYLAWDHQSFTKTEAS